jgi:hypothetical protein
MSAPSSAWISRAIASEEEAADKKAVELLNNSPYKDKLGNAGLFLKAVQARAPAVEEPDPRALRATACSMATPPGCRL